MATHGTDAKGSSPNDSRPGSSAPAFSINLRVIDHTRRPLITTRWRLRAMRNQARAIKGVGLAVLFLIFPAQRAWAVGGYQRPETLRECSSFQPRYTVPLVARSRGLARCSAPSSPDRDTRIAHTPEAPSILIAPDRAHLAGAQMHVHDLPPKAVRAVGGGVRLETRDLSLEDSGAGQEVDHGQLKSNRHGIYRPANPCHGAPGIFSFAAFDRPSLGCSRLTGPTMGIRAVGRTQRDSIENRTRSLTRAALITSPNRRYSATKDQLAKAAGARSNSRIGGSWKFTNTFVLKGIAS